MDPKYFKSLSFCIAVILIITWSRPTAAFRTVKSLPGFPSPLPFKLETGYIGVEDAEYFYYFIESENNPAEDPLVLWLSGGPGCTSLSGIVITIGPVRLLVDDYNGGIPTFEPHPYSWTKLANIIFLDAPVRTGFSYFSSWPGSNAGDRRNANDIYHFLKKWLLSHPKFIKNPLYIAAESYSGKIAPIITQAISDGIEDGSASFMNLKGYLVGNPLTDMRFDDDNARIPFYHRIAMISDELYESAKRNCKEEYVEVDMGNAMCRKDLQAIEQLVAHINIANILYPYCPESDIKLANRLYNNRKSFLETNEASCHPQNHGCRRIHYDLLGEWANDISVRKALGIRMGTVKTWLGCYNCSDYVQDVKSGVSYHGYLNAKGYKALVYSGDHDTVVPYVGTIAWIRSLNLSIVDPWRPWFVDDQVAGYSIEFQNNFTFATIKGGGHTAPEYNPKECFAMFKRWISHQPL